MKFVLTLLVDPAAATLTGPQVELAAAALAENGAAVGTADWLADAIACDIPFDSLEPDIADASVRQYLADAPVDIFAQASAGRRKLLLVADMDSTIIGQECINELADFAGRREDVAQITDRAMRGELDFADALRARATMLCGLAFKEMERAYDERVQLNTGARTLVQTMRKAGAYAALVSGGFSFFTSRVRSAAGFDSDQANELELRSGVVTGEVLPPILDRSAKLAALVRLSAAHRLDLSQTLAVGDGDNDIAMIQAAGLGAAYHAQSLVAAAARARIDHGDLTALLYFQGYRRAEFVE